MQGIDNRSSEDSAVNNLSQVTLLSKEEAKELLERHQNDVVEAIDEFR